MCHIFDKNYKLPKNLELDLGGFDSAMKEIEINLDKIAKDIRERKDNAMAMEFTRVIGELLKKNGVVPKITEVRNGGTFDKDRNVIEERYGVLVDGLDFSEHDRPFEDGLSELGHCVQVLEGKIDTLRSRCTEKARDLFDRDCYGALTISCHSNEMEFENKQLKQRIAELESNGALELPFDPLECANYLINATYERETSSLERTFSKSSDKVNEDKYSIDDLEQIAEHLLVYCKHNKETE